MKNSVAKNFIKARIKEADKHFRKIKEIVAKTPNPLAGMSEEQIIEKLRKTREELWEKKIGSRT